VPVARHSSVVATEVANESLLKTLKTLTKNSDFQNVFQRGTKCSSGVLVVFSASQPPDEALPRVGFVASRKVGNAPARNRAKRRLRAAARVVSFQSNRDFVVVATKQVLYADFTDIIGWLEDCSNTNTKQGGK
jgi:ribonuclease P protein component